MVFEYNDVYYDVVIMKKNNKHLYIRVNDEMKIVVSCPFLYTKSMIQKIIDENRHDIIKMLDIKKKRNINKDKESNCLLGNPLLVKYEEVKRPKFDGNIIIVKDEEMLNRWYKNTAKEVFKKYLDEAYYVFEEEIPYPKLKVRLMKTRWGVCNRKDNSVTLNLELIKKDQECLNYVIVHELSHFVHFDHSKAFWQTVSKYCPEYKKVRKVLKD